MKKRNKKYNPNMNLIEKTELKECDHDWNETTSHGDAYRFFVCKHCDSAQNYVPFDVTVKPWSDEETDHCTDIKNHISPNTKVIEHE